MRVGFTGTREGLTPAQYSRLYNYIGGDIRPTEFHHGCCLGADASAADIADRRWGVAVIHAHPSTLKGMTSENAVRVSQVHHAADAPLDRNRDIVDACDVLIACPKGPEEQRSGTWATVRYARKQGKRVVILWPNGEVTEEG